MKLLTKLFLLLLKARYRIRVKGLNHIKSDQQYLILPNHITHLEPMIIWSLVSPKIQLRPVVTSKFANSKLAGRFFRKLRAISVEDVERVKDEQGISEHLNGALTSLKNALLDGDSVLLYPAGQLAGQGLEYLGGKKSAYLAVQSCPPSTKILGVRIRGLRGSIWSRARNGQSPSFLWTSIKSIWYLLANGFFFMPKREIIIEFTEQTKSFKTLAQGQLKDFNQALEAFYNEPGEEKVNYLQHYRFWNDTKRKHLPEYIHNSIKSFQQTQSYKSSDFDPQITEAIKEEIRTLKNLNKNENLDLDQNLILDLYLDSLDMAELKNTLLSRYPKASNTPLLELKTIADLVAMAMGLSKSEKDNFKPCNRQIKIQNHEWMLDENKNILEHFKNQWKSEKKASQIYDSLFGLQTRNDIVLKALLISDYLKKIEGKEIGIMLPAVSSTSILVLACYLANKVPVMMNWTHSEPAFAHCVAFSNTKKILTSKAFFSKINIPRLQKYDFVFLEDLLKNIPLHRKLKALCTSWFFPTPNQLDEIAVVLYTSGSEALPKAVPLTHKNLISNLKGALQILHIQHDEKLFCYLPPFHSFGFTVNTILPLVAGLGSINTPDPNDSLTVAKLIAHSKPTLLATTPTFLRNLMNIANSDQLSSLRYIITGGEKCSESVFEKAKKLIPSAKILEGYGITECSPIIAINPLEKQKKQSVGIALGNAAIKILDIETHQEQSTAQEGMIYYSGPSVFQGYQDPTLESPFLEIGGKMWYRTGDLGYLDQDGYLYITGRKKRFLKLGGEMISLPFLEALLYEKYGNSEVANLAIEGKETENGVYIAIFTVDIELKVAEINAYLRSKGVSSLIEIDEVKPIGALPLLGSGKIDYKILRGMIE